MAFKKSGDNNAAIGNVTGNRVKVNTEGDDSCEEYTLKQIPFHLTKKTTSIPVNPSTGPDVILIYTLKQCEIYYRQGDFWFHKS